MKDLELRDLVTECYSGQLDWGEAYRIANNLTEDAMLSESASSKSCMHWLDQVEGLAYIAANEKMKALGFHRDDNGYFSHD